MKQVGRNSPNMLHIEDGDKGVVAQLFVNPGETMKLDEKENPAAGAGFYQAMPGEVYYVVIPPRLPLPRYASNLCPCVLEVETFGWNHEGTLTTVTGFRPFLITAAGVKIPITSDVAKPRMIKSKLYFKLKDHQWGDYWVLTRYGQVVVDRGDPLLLLPNVPSPHAFWPLDRYQNPPPAEGTAASTSVALRRLSKQTSSPPPGPTGSAAVLPRTTS